MSDVLASSAAGVDLVFFDVVETLFSLEAVRRRLDEHGAGDAALEFWFARFLRDGFALASAGTYRPFREVAASSLADVLRSRGITPRSSLVEEILAAMAELEPHSDARPALELVAARGLRAVTLTNGSVAATQSLLNRADLRQLVDDCLSVDDVRAWKPRPEPYAWACEVTGTAPGRAALVAVHSWDIHGAAAAGLRTGWCSRLEGQRPAVFTAATVQGATLVEVVDQLTSAGGPAS